MSAVSYILNGLIQSKCSLIKGFYLPFQKQLDNWSRKFPYTAFLITGQLNNIYYALMSHDMSPLIGSISIVLFTYIPFIEMQ
jgi:hypothetical protein